jgi:hypothetical protein
LEATLSQIREERERLQLRYNELGLSLVTAQEELEHGDNAEATANMAQQIAVLIEDLSLGRQELEGLQAYSDRTRPTQFHVCWQQ